MRRDTKSGPMRLSGPDGFLLTYVSKPGSQGTVQVARVDLESVALIGKRQMVPGKISPEVMVIVENGRGERRLSTALQ